uniref:Carbohydrate sulfotransferase 9 n=1 Tax=Rousettus aegyptiacus TaxID=9407 RepID=A0A7J8DFL2_ROUAE|nr:carbohydrate sulfotransferase 9 [Rousettus aegyptiacus]
MQPSEMVMNPKQVFLSLLIFGVAGLLLFMYLQVWIEEQHTGEGMGIYTKLSPRSMKGCLLGEMKHLIWELTVLLPVPHPFFSGYSVTGCAA